jgi:hypothetical protein
VWPHLFLQKHLTIGFGNKTVPDSQTIYGGCPWSYILSPSSVLGPLKKDSCVLGGFCRAGIEPVLSRLRKQLDLVKSDLCALQGQRQPPSLWAGLWGDLDKAILPTSLGSCLWSDTDA